MSLLVQVERDKLRYLMLLIILIVLPLLMASKRVVILLILLNPDLLHLELPMEKSMSLNSPDYFYLLPLYYPK